MNINKNKGMYIEELINRTIDYYWYNKDNIYFEKRFVPFKILKIMNNNVFLGKLLSKSTVDYTGVFKHRHLEFEVKQTEKDFFDFSLIKKHQWMFMNRMNKMGICCFLIVCFSLNDIILLVPFCAIKKFIDEKIKKIPFLQLQKESYKMEVIYPGIINLAEILNKIIC
ncbi:MAG: Holliday junction resolvase RecU [Mycoplasmataceae bacterium]|nr:Holliday junction resolvase RecU [Mycoplasmataceae bacterium]